jgi:hypothetical protein
MAIEEFLKHCRGAVRITLADGSAQNGRFRTDIVTPTALSAYFYGDDHDMSLPIHLIDTIQHIEEAAIAS